MVFNKRLFDDQKPLSRGKVQDNLHNLLFLGDVSLLVEKRAFWVHDDMNR